MADVKPMVGAALQSLMLSPKGNIQKVAREDLITVVLYNIFGLTVKQYSFFPSK